MEGIPEITPAQRHLEELTHSQANSKLWKKFWSGQITASHYYQAVHTNPHKLALSLVRDICYPNTVRFASAATKYGCDHGKMIQAYKLKMLESHKVLKVSPAGLVVCIINKACFGASPSSFLE